MVLTTYSKNSISLKHWVNGYDKSTHIKQIYDDLMYIGNIALKYIDPDVSYIPNYYLVFVSKNYLLNATLVVGLYTAIY